MEKRLFGTDGIRGLAGEFPLDPATAFALGVALGAWAAGDERRPEVLIGADTRESGVWLAEMVAGGLSRAGARAHSAGIITTPGIAHLTRTQSFLAGVMISASHNPYQDNGIKVFDHSGFKLPDEVELALEGEILRLREVGPAPDPLPLRPEPQLRDAYLDHLASAAPGLNGLAIVVDCGHGAASGLAPALLRRLGADVRAIGCQPDGRNINQGCGALFLEPLRQEVLRSGAALGVAFDGDADRAMFISRSGRVIDGDCVLLACGRDLHRKGKLAAAGGEPVVVGTVMSNLGLEQALAAEGIRLLRTPVGDKYVLEEMRRRNATLGGEPSGHVIFRHLATTGDGLLTALRVLALMLETGGGLDELTAGLALLPQKLVNVPVKRKRSLAELPAVAAEIRAAEKLLGDSGRVLVRFSGTESVARVMVEGPDEREVERLARRIAAAVRQELGGG